MGPVTGHRGQEPGLAAASQQVATTAMVKQLGVTAGRHRAGPRRDGDGPGRDQVIDQHIDADEQVLGRQHGGGLYGRTVFVNRLSAAEALMISATRRDQPP